MLLLKINQVNKLKLNKQNKQNFFLLKLQLIK